VEITDKKKGPLLRSHFFNELVRYPSAEQAVEVPGPVSKYSGIHHFPAAGALPGIERADEIVILLGEHPTFAFWAFHEQLPPGKDEKLIR
jgi:hypothetical protein